MVMGDTIAAPGGDAALVRVHGTNKALALATDVTPRYCYADPQMGGMQAVVENWRNITATGAMPLAITNCLNFGSPERPDIMGQFVACLDGMGQACRHLAYPIISGNVSFYNETNGTGILPTPAIGGVGLLDDIDHRAEARFQAEGEMIFVIGKTKGHLGCSLYLRDVVGRDNAELGTPPAVNLADEKAHGDFIRAQIKSGQVKSVHDVSDGGLLVALAEMALASNIGFQLSSGANNATHKDMDMNKDMYMNKDMNNGTTNNIGTNALPPHAFWFGEDQARYVVSLAPDKTAAFVAAAKKAAIPLTELGKTQKGELTLDDELLISIEALRQAHESWFPNFMAHAPNAQTGKQ